MAKRSKDLKGRTQPILQRPIRFRNYEYFFLIVCEDENTEPAYFEQFQAQVPENTFFLRRIGTGLDPKGVVERTILEREKLKIEAKKEVDETWAVFDKDDADENATKIQRFEQAFSIAEQEQIELAYSNEVFELWLLLHLTIISHQIPLSRQAIYQRLETEIRRRPGFETFTYQHGDTDILDKIQRLGDESAAIRRAETLFQAQSGTPPIEANPSTRVYLIVKSLREKIAFYAWQPDDKTSSGHQT